MDWENKFYSIVKETEDNIAKAKEKLSGKASSIVDVFLPRQASPENPHRKLFPDNLIPDPLPDISDLNMSSDHHVQILQLQEQLNYQSRTIEKLQKLVISLNNERDFYKEQILQLKGDMDKLTDKMSSQFIAASSANQASAMKRELMHEIEKLKSMLQKFAEEASSAKRSSLSPSWNEDFWNMKEDLTESLEKVHREINAINKRIDKLESPLGAEHCERSRPSILTKNVHGTDRFLRSQPVYTPLYKSSDAVNGLDLQQLRQTVNSLNCKLDSLEKKFDTAQPLQPPVYSHSLIDPVRHSYVSTSRKSSLLDIENDDLHSVSDLSDISSLSDNNTDDSINDLTSELRNVTTSKRRRKNKSSAYKTGKSKPVHVEFSLSDSDIDDDLETDSLDLEN